MKPSAVRNISFVALVLLGGCANVPPAHMSSVRHAEDRLGTGGPFLDYQYHVLSEDRHASALNFEGYMLAFEKGKRELIGMTSPWLSCSFLPTNEARKRIFDESGLAYKSDLIRDYPEWVNFACKRLDDRERIFLSHAVTFEYEQDPIPHVSSLLTFSIYPTNHQDQGPLADVLKCREEPLAVEPDGARCLEDDRIYAAGWDYLTKRFNKELASKLRGGSYTHIIIASMGWNTNELETIQDYNSLMGHLFDAAKQDDYKIFSGEPFHPLFIDLAWPSAWTFRTSRIASLQRGLSVINKGYDADELGLTWYGALINVAVRDAIDQSTASGRSRPTIVVLGHSYGARALSHAVAACPFFPELNVEHCKAAPPADIVIGLQGAFNRSRFLQPEVEGHYPEGTVDLYIYRDGVPFQRYDVLLGHGTRNFYLWSAYDAATTRFNIIGGGEDVCRYVMTHPERFSLVTCAQTVAQVFGGEYFGGSTSEDKTVALDACKAASEFFTAVGPCLEAATQREWGISPFVTDAAHVLLIDASGLVHNETPLHGGGAHSDIYKWEIGKVVWQIIRENSRPR